MLHSTVCYILEYQIFKSSNLLSNFYIVAVVYYNNNDLIFIGFFATKYKLLTIIWVSTKKIIMIITYQWMRYINDILTKT